MTSMKVIVYMAMSIDGYIARKDGKTDFVSETEFASYTEKIREIGNVIMGRNTYEEMLKNQDAYMPDTAMLVVLSHTKESSDGVLLATSPQEALQLLEQKGFSTVLIGGGAETYQAFINAGLVDETVVDVEPAVLGSGIRAFNSAIQFELIDTKQLSKNEIQLHYKVLK